MRTALALVDGEHYPPVVRAALEAMARAGTRPVAALFLGGTEKVAGHGAAVDLGIPVEWSPRGGGIPAAAGVMTGLLARYAPDVVVDLSDEPVLDPRRRLQLASHALLAGVTYEGPDFRFDPPPRPVVATRPTIAVIGLAKRSGKTAVAGELVRTLRRLGRTPVLVAMGRGGPPSPAVLPAGTVLDLDTLLAVADAGGHAASDGYEDALTTGEATVAARRCGGGLAGAVADSNVVEAVRAAEALPGDVTVLEGSGAALPPLAAGSCVLVVPAGADPEFLHGYLGPYRVLLADVVIVTMDESPRSSPSQREAILGAIRSISQHVPVVRTVFRPVPLGPVSGKVFFATTAPAVVTAQLAESLEQRYDCEVVATSSHLADRPALQADLRAAGAFDVLLVELKAAAVDVAARAAARSGARVVFCDNRPTVVGTDGPVTETPSAFADAVERLVRLADERF